MAHRIPSEYTLETEVSAEERRRIAERFKLRQALRKEFISKVTDPYGGEILDKMMVRHQAAAGSNFEYFKPKPRYGFKAFCLSLVPIVAFGLLTKKEHDAFWENCATGKIPYEKRLFKTVQ